MTMTANHNATLHPDARHSAHHSAYHSAYYSAAPNVSSSTSVSARLIALNKMTLQDLRAQWHDLYKTECPKTYGQQKIVSRLTHRIQELAMGGDSQETKARLEQQARRYSQSGRANELTLTPGMVLTRVYQGVEHQALVLENGKFQCDGCIYNSLSAIAKRIAGGTSWNGKLFFGIKERATRSG